MADPTNRRGNQPQDDNIDDIYQETLDKQWNRIHDKVSDTMEYIKDQTESFDSKLGRKLDADKGFMGRAVEAFQSSQRKDNAGDGLNMKERVIGNLLERTGKGKQFNTDWKDVALKIGKEVGKIIAGCFDNMVMKPLKQGFSEMSSTYEANFTAIAGALSSDRKSTTDLMHGTISELRKLPFKDAINANKDLIPELRKVAESGINDPATAMRIAITNALDAKIMPWLDTSSKTWTNMQINLSEQKMNEIKGQQLFLKESQSGSRLLQSGVINSLNDELAPLLTQIDANTAKYDRMGPEAKAMMDIMVESGMPENDAYKEIQDLIRVDKNKYAALTSGKATDILAAEAAANGGNLGDILKAKYSGFQKSDDIGVGAQAEAMGGGFENFGYGNTAGSLNSYLKLNEKLGKELDARTKQIREAGKTKYGETASTAAEKVTRTQEKDNNKQNWVTDNSYWMNEFPHMVDNVETIASGVGKIITLLGGFIGGTIISKIAGTVLDKVGGKLLGKVTGNIAEKVGGKVLKDGIKATAKKVGGKVAQSTIGKTATKVGGKVVSKVAKIGSKGLGAIALGAETAIRGTKDAIQYGKEGSKKTAALAGGGAALGAAGVGAVLLGSNPIGWAVAAAGAVAVGAAKVADHFNTFSKQAGDAAKRYKENASALDKSMSEYNQKWEDLAKKINTNKATKEDVNQARSSLVEEGVISQKDAESMSDDEIKELVKSRTGAASSQSLAAKAFDKKTENLVRDSSKKNLDAMWDGMEGKNTSKDLEAYTSIYTQMAEKSEKIDDDDLAKVNDKLQALKEAESKGDSAAINKAADALRSKLRSDMRTMTKETDEEGNLRIRTSEVFDAANTAGIDAVDTEEEATSARNIAQQISQLYNTWKTNKTPTGAQTLVQQFQQLADLKMTETDIKDELTKAFGLDTIKQDLEAAGQKVPSYQKGSRFIPEDQLAELHKGERVLTTTENRDFEKSQHRLLSVSETLESMFKRLKDSDSKQPTDTVTLQERNDKQNAKYLLEAAKGGINKYIDSREKEDKRDLLPDMPEKFDYKSAIFSGFRGGAQSEFGSSGNDQANQNPSNLSKLFDAQEKAVKSYVGLMYNPYGTIKDLWARKNNKVETSEPANQVEQPSLKELLTKKFETDTQTQQNTEDRIQNAVDKLNIADITRIGIATEPNKDTSKSYSDPRAASPIQPDNASWHTKLKDLWSRKKADTDEGNTPKAEPDQSEKLRNAGSIRMLDVLEKKSAREDESQQERSKSIVDTFDKFKSYSDNLNKAHENPVSHIISNPTSLTDESKAEPVQAGADPSDKLPPVTPDVSDITRVGIADTLPKEPTAAPPESADTSTLLQALTDQTQILSAILDAVKSVNTSGGHGNIDDIFKHMQNPMEGATSTIGKSLIGMTPTIANFRNL